MSSARPPVAIAGQFVARVLWMAVEELLPGRTYVMKSGASTALATVTSLKHRISINTLEHSAAKTLLLNEIGLCNLSLDKMIAFEPYAESRDLGSFILIDGITNQTIGLGLIDFALRRASNIHWQNLEVAVPPVRPRRARRPQ